MNPHGAPIWYELHTPDHAQAKRFYDAVVGWSVGPAPAGPIDYRMIDADDGQVGGVMQLTPEMTAGGAQPGWLCYIGVDDVDGAAARVTAGGGAVLTAPFDMPDVGRMAFVADPDGAPFYLMRGAGDGDSTAFAPGRAGRATWQELFVPDANAALAFYEHVLGWTSPHAMPMGPGREYHFVHRGDQVLGGIGDAAEAQAARWRVYFEVADLDAAIERIAAEGGRVTSGPHEVPGGSRMIQGTDPTGVDFALVSTPRES